VYNFWKRASNLRERSPHAGVACYRARCPKEVNDEAHIAQHRCIGIVSLADLATEGSLPKTAKALHGISQPGGQHNQSA
jgi:hypothetical protein